MRTHRHILTWLAVLLLAGLAAPLAAGEAEVPVQETWLDNGLRLLMVERHDTPSVACGWVAHVGSANETYGITGIAHLHEHMMFKGSSTIGTTDYEAEMVIMDRLDAIRVEMEAEYSLLREAKRRGDVEGNIYDLENQTDRLGELREQMKKLQEEQREYTVKDEFDKIYTAMGASSMNAGTSEDFTVYFITVPANKLELWFWMESERLLNRVFREFYSERDVVREERRMRVESDPTAKYEEQYDSTFWTSTPYHHPVVGWPADVESISREQANAFFGTFYAPNNLTAALVGDFNPAEALKLAEKYLGRIPSGPKVPEVVTEEIEQLQPLRMYAEADTNPSVQIRWHTAPFVHKDRYALDLMSGILSARTGRLYKGLVEENKLATGEPYAYGRPMKYAGMFEIGAELADGVTHQQVEDALLVEIEKMKNEPVGERELQKVKNQSTADTYRRFQSNFFLMLQLLIFDTWGDWHFLNDAPAKWDAVTPDDIMRVANNYFTKDDQNILWYSREEGTEEDPEIAALPAQAKAMVKQTLAQLAQVDDPAQLGQILAQMQAAQGQVPEEMKAAVELIISKIQERLDGLQAAEGMEE